MWGQGKATNYNHLLWHQIFKSHAQAQVCWFLVFFILADRQKTWRRKDIVEELVLCLSLLWCNRRVLTLFRSQKWMNDGLIDKENSRRCDATESVLRQTSCWQQVHLLPRTKEVKVYQYGLVPLSVHKMFAFKWHFKQALESSFNLHVRNIQRSLKIKWIYGLLTTLQPNCP